jgi:hypothetical protein
MMPDGLHVGLAAWIDAQHSANGFTTWPALPIGTQLVNVEAVQTMSDLSRAAEFARMVNFTPRKGQYAEPFAGDPLLWETHRDLLGRMIFAVRTWSAQEDRDLAAARAILYQEGPHGFPVMTAAYQLYDELRIAYRELTEAGADAADVTAALAAWDTAGRRLEIEAALATITRLGRRSSLPQAETERLSLTPELLPATADGAYAATSFAPMSAVRDASWLNAEATLDELEQALGDAEPRAKWTAWRAARTGSVQFRYAVLEIHRPWFTRALYEADDWRLPDDGSASRGDGITGELPAYVRSVYLVQVSELKTDAKPTPPPPPIRYPVLRPPFQRPFPGSATPRPGVMVAPAAAPPAPAPVVTPSLALTTRAPVLVARNVPFGRLQQVTIVDVTARLSIAQDLIAQRTATGVPVEQNVTTPVEAIVVGFGCVPLPASPTPNPVYQWNHS